MTFLTRFFVCSSRSSSISTGHDFLLERKVGGVNHHLHNTLGQLTTAWEGLSVDGRNSFSNIDIIVQHVLKKENGSFDCDST